jgi:hypothetical protein
MTLRARIGLSLCVVSVCVSASTSALAIPARPAAWELINADTPIVADGVLLFAYFPGDVPSGTPLELAPVVSNAMGTEIAGAVEELSITTTYKIFRPAAAFATPGPFTLSNIAFAFGSFSTTAPVALQPPTPVMTISPEVFRVPSDQRCCTGVVPDILPGGSGGIPSCVAVVSTQSPRFNMAFEPSLSDSAARQFLYRTSLTSPTPAMESVWKSATETRGGWRLDPTERADSYCYEVEAHRLTDGQRFVIAEACEADEFGEIVEVSPSEDDIRFALGIYSCLAPPSELTQAWCDVNRDTCSDPMQQFNCEMASYATTCASFPPSGMTLIDLVANAGPPGSGPTAGAGAGSGATGGSGAVGGMGAGDAGAAGIAGAGGAAGAAGAAGASGAAGMSPSDPTSGDSSITTSSGCSATPLERTTLSPAWWLLACLAVIRASRRSRRR